jgi:hypothetical protein
VTAVRPRFDAVVHMPPRLQVCGLLAAVDDMDFALVREQVGVSKSPRASRVRTNLALTVTGRAAFDAHVAELRRITGA